MASPARIQVWPNPSRAGVHLRLEAPAGNVESVEIFDIAGRKVKRFPIAGHHLETLVRDGSGDDGRKVSAGAYVVRARTEQGARSAVLLRTR